jgi:hypothetical protein
MLLLLDLSKTDPAAASSAIAQPLLQLLGPAVQYCLQQQQQRQQAAAVRDVQVIPPWTPNDKVDLVEGFQELLRIVLKQSE